MPIQVELLRGSSAPTEIDFLPLSDIVYGQSIDTSIAIGTVPPTIIDVYPQRATVLRGAFSRTVEGPSRYRWGGTNLIVESRSYDQQLGFLADQTGRVIFIHSPEQILDQKQMAILREQTFPRKGYRKKIDFAELFADVTIFDPQTFEKLSFGEVIRFFREELDLSIDQLAEQANLSTVTIRRIERETNSITQSFNDMPVAFGFGMTDPRRRIIEEAYLRERSKKSKRSGKTIGRPSHLGD